MTSDQELEGIHTIAFTEQQWQLIAGLLIVQAQAIEYGAPSVVMVRALATVIENLGRAAGINAMVDDIHESYGLPTSRSRVQ
jgi:hypothetical protein